MRILHISWEYPPLVYGGLGRHVHALAEAQAARGHEVTVLTQQGPGATSRERMNGVDVLRVTPPTPEVPRDPDQLVAWVDLLDARMAEAGTLLVATLQPDVLHAHDWVVSQAAEAARRACPAPLVVTIHATEAGRHQGWVTSGISRRIHAAEYRITNQAQMVIACSRAMRGEVNILFDVPNERIDVIPNGIDLDRWQVPDREGADGAKRWRTDAARILFLGRLEWEKGIHTLLDAAAMLRDDPDRNFELLVAGTGTYQATLKEQARDLIQSGTVTFTGWVPEQELRELTAAADLVVVPSLYEPFGLVALEAGALGVPLVVSDRGGLADIVTDAKTGRTFAAGDASKLADAIGSQLDDREAADAMATRLTGQLRERFDWSVIANQTVATYRRAIEESAVSPRPLRVVEAAPSDVNLLTPPADS
ncbi:MAG: glycosyltransferase family 4 protein [Candidatus Nanopelagicales bacterium]